MGRVTRHWRVWLMSEVASRQGPFAQDKGQRTKTLAQYFGAVYYSCMKKAVTMVVNAALTIFWLGIIWLVIFTPDFFGTGRHATPHWNLPVLGFLICVLLNIIFLWSNYDQRISPLVNRLLEAATGISLASCITN